jgi:hypothetical protein
MPKLKDVDINYEQIRELVRQLEFEKKMDLIREVIKEKGYKENFYLYTEGLTKKYNIPKMSEEELDKFLHEKN